MTFYLKYLLITEFHFDAILYSTLRNENSDAGHTKCSRGPQVPHPCLFKILLMFITNQSITTTSQAF